MTLHINNNIKEKYFVRCEGKCIKPCNDIIETYFSSIKKCNKFIGSCKKRKAGYRCEAEIFIHEIF